MIFLPENDHGFVQLEKNDTKRSTKFQIYNTSDGSVLPGCDNIEPGKLENIFVSPLDKNTIFLTNSTRRMVHLIDVKRSFQSSLHLDPGANNCQISKTNIFLSARFDFQRETAKRMC